MKFQERSGSSVPPILNRMDNFEDPPTYNRTNKFTNAFQALFDAYGIATYREVNPSEHFFAFTWTLELGRSACFRRSSINYLVGLILIGSLTP